MRYIESRASRSLRYFDSMEDDYSIEVVRGPWNPVASKPLRKLVGNLYARSFILDNGERVAQVILESDLLEIFAYSGFPFYQGEEMPFNLTQDFQAFLLRDVFKCLDIYLESTLEDVNNEKLFCWAKKPIEDYDDEEGICLGYAESMLDPKLPDISFEVEYLKTSAKKVELNREESLVAFLNFFVTNKNLSPYEIEFLLEFDIPEVLKKILKENAFGIETERLFEKILEALC